jgi:hypothetical protein
VTESELATHFLGSTPAAAEPALAA